MIIANKRDKDCEPQRGDMGYLCCDVIPSEFDCECILFIK
ncbi:MAG: hypothetical protein JETT_0041 [Candidatus Jettenia ecosi]|uniref:Uncharacterized protein n=1 Tax=Candidatus Jettenia ecosi TaxID=2494326 RepID=A0A533QSJ2_9BACT|nr:MAG: hypothetical protein JETT_0041 [Candidatus Jettenia ecosi]